MAKKKKDAYKIEIVNSILDNVHGFIGLTPVENTIERLPIFKRLQNISQLGLTNRIFPCALHNRYIHSLGVMYIVDQMAIKLNFDSDERQIIRLAGMLHDIGHYPFSHDVEAAYMDASSITAADPATEFLTYAENAKKKINKIALPIEKLDFHVSGRDSKYHHESVGTTVITHSSGIKNAIIDFYINNNEKFTKEDPNEVVDEIISDICSVITGDAQHESKYFPNSFGIMVQIMHSELDADRIDYLLRDATFSGASYGNFDLGVLIQNLVSIKDPFFGSTIVGITPKGIGCAEQFLLNRYFAYNQIIYHKYTSVLGCALQSIVRWLIQDTSSGFPHKDIINMAEHHESDSRYINYTDAYLINFINNIDTSKVPCPNQIYKLVGCIQNYRALDMSEEVVCSGIDLDDVARKLEHTKLFENLNNAISDGDVSNVVYQYREMRLTNHLPEERFEALLAENIKNGVIESDLADSYRLDRLQDGLVIIQPGEKPKMLIDSERSMIHDIHTLRYCVLRAYSV